MKDVVTSENGDQIQCIAIKPPCHYKIFMAKEDAIYETQYHHSSECTSTMRFYVRNNN